MKPPNFFSKKNTILPTFCYNCPVSRHFFLIFKRKRRQFYKNCRPFQILVFYLQFLTENKKHIKRNIERFSLCITLVWQEAGTDSPFWCFLASFTKETHNQRITNKKSHFSKEFSTNPHIFRRSLKKVSFIEESFLGKVSFIKEISYDFSSFIKENVVSLHPD